MDKIHIRDLEIRCIIGTNPDERVHAQQVVLNVVLECELARAGRTDRIEDTVNYRTLKKQIVEEISESRYLLLESMVRHVADICLGCEGVCAVTVTADKPGALRRARSVAVEIRRERPA